jgi:hypothetical protein
MNTTAQNAAQLIVDCARENGYLDGPLSCIPTLAEEEKKLFIRMFGELRTHLAGSGRAELTPDEISSLFTFLLAKAAELTVFYVSGKEEEISLLGMFDGKIPLYADDRLLGFCRSCTWPKEAAEAFLNNPPAADDEEAGDPLLVLFEALKWSFRISCHLVIGFLEDNHSPLKGGN